ncbi:IS1 family transposase [Trichocoleus sp. FACHB-262]|uniref:IS1 family transposase n=1 Tax=Trichocoleus sp. FACHB-262 TaxID=2692869 RepID=UPI001686D244|nr:IS1 family transposase [Trichocoleus sp. FACHB-262]MBD2122360.1 IS1 family transposase [Trichocoleus sp. FACHB-262]
MNVESTFEAEKNLTLIARKTVLQEWDLTRQIRKLVCPHCKSVRVIRLMQSRNGCEYGCKDCRQDISEENLPKCCPYPGKYVKCQDCRYFQAFAKAVKAKVQELRHLSPEERAARVAEPTFYQNSKPVLAPVQPQTFTESDLAIPFSEETSNPVQLSLFEKIKDSSLNGEEPKQHE